MKVMIMDEHRKKLADMAQQIRRGEYRVEPVAVADAILRQLRGPAAARSEHVCSDEPPAPRTPCSD